MAENWNLILTVAGFLVTMATILWKGAQTEERQTQMIAAIQARITELETNRNQWRERLEHDIDSRFSAYQAMQSLVQSQIADTRERLAGDYMKKPEIDAIERRVSDKQKELVETMREINNKVDRLLNRNMS